ncbi:hypothetical protein KKG66_02065, partial [bacterium]|nr:hypothetical protein [bacterium]
APILLNLDNDPALEIVQHSAQGDVKILEPDGTLILSAELECGPILSPLAGDLDGDGMLETVVTQGPGFSGKGKMIFAELGVPARLGEVYDDSPRYFGIRSNVSRLRIHCCPQIGNRIS